MRQKSIGEVLHAARESGGWTFLELQRALSIRAKFLQALEYNDFDAIPDPTYARAYLKSYAEFLELDADVLLDAYDRKSLVIYYEAGEERDVAVALRSKQKQRKGSYLPLIYLILATCSILTFVGYVVYTRLQQHPIKTPSPSYQVVSETTVTPTTVDASTTTTATSQTSVKVTPNADKTSLQVAVSQAQKPIDIQLSVTEVTSWISVTGTDLAGGVTLSPENKTVTTTLPTELQDTKLTLGVVKGVTLKIAGKSVDLSGLTSETGTVHITIE